MIADVWKNNAEIKTKKNVVSILTQTGAYILHCHVQNVSVFPRSWLGLVSFDDDKGSSLRPPATLPQLHFSLFTRPPCRFYACSLSQVFATNSRFYVISYFSQRSSESVVVLLKRPISIAIPENKVQRRRVRTCW